MSASPAPESISSSSFVAAKKVPPAPPKPINVFSNDGSFLERFKKETVEQKEKQQQEEAAKRKKTLEDRIKNRGKRAASAEDGLAAKKKAKGDAKELTAYEKEVARIRDATDLRDHGIGIRPTLK